MNKYEEGIAPVYKIDDIPAYKAGEWPGIKSNKFENTRRIIRAVEKGIFFSEKEPIKKPLHKTFTPRNSSEYVFRPCLKKVKPIDSRTLHQLGEGISPTPPEINGFIPRVYEFQKIEKYHLKKQEEQNKYQEQYERLTLSVNSSDNDIRNIKQNFQEQYSRII